jgi:hypothetical protein
MDCTQAVAKKVKEITLEVISHIIIRHCMVTMVMNKYGANKVKWYFSN